MLKFRQTGSHYTKTKVLDRPVYLVIQLHQNY